MFFLLDKKRGAPANTVNPLASVPWVAQWKFNNNANDSVGSNNLTASASSPTFTTGLIGGATGASQFTAASSQYWSIADNAALSLNSANVTIALWVKLSSKTNWRSIVSKTNEYEIGYEPSSVDRFYFAVSPTGVWSGAYPVKVYANALGSPSLNTWYCIIARYDGTNIYISVNDGAENSTAFSAGIYNGTSDFRIGIWDGTNSALDGLIDNVCIAKSAGGGGGALTAAQRTAFYNGGNGTETLT